MGPMSLPLLLKSERELTDERSKSQEDENDAEEIVPHWIDRWEGTPVRMDVVYHILGHRIEQLGTGRITPDFEGPGDQSRVEHDAVGCSLLRL